MSLDLQISMLSSDTP